MKTQGECSLQELSQISSPVAPWDDPDEDIWDKVVEVPEEYGEYISRLGLGLCYTYTPDRGR